MTQKPDEDKLAEGCVKLIFALFRGAFWLGALAIETWGIVEFFRHEYPKSACLMIFALTIEITLKLSKENKNTAKMSD